MGFIYYDIKSQVLNLLQSNHVDLKVLSGPNRSGIVATINPITLSEIGINDQQIIEISKLEGVFPLRIKASESCPPGVIVLPKWVMYRLGLIDGEKVSLNVIKEVNELKKVKIRVLGSFKDWLETRKTLINYPVFLDQNIPLNHKVNAIILDMEPWTPNSVGLITEDTLVETQYSGLYNYIVVVDQSRLMLEKWRGVSKYRIARAFFRNKAQYKIRRAATISILTLSDEPMIYINWMKLQIDLRMVFQTILVRIFDNITPLPELDPPNYIDLMKFLEKHIEGGIQDYPTVITILSAREFDYGDKEETLRIFNELRRKFGPYLRIIGIPLGPTYGGRYETLRTLTIESGGTFLEVKSPSELLAKAGALSNVIDFRGERAGEW